MGQEYDMSRVHEANLKILKEIDRICRKYQIHYGLDAGTLIGAVRHHGFIPWDDDADVAFTRDQYEAFHKVAAKELPDTMELVEPDSLRGGKAFFDFTPRIIYKNSRCHENTPQMRFYEGRLNHLWVDLFIIDRLPASRLGIRVTRLLQQAVYGMAMGHRDSLDFTKYSLMNRLFVGVLASVGRWIPMKRIFALQRFLSLKDRNSKGSLSYFSNYQPDYLYVTVENSWYARYENMEFEDTILMVPRGWHQVLTEVYGDYMKLPPKEKRVPTHSSMEIEILD